MPTRSPSNNSDSSYARPTSSSSNHQDLAVSRTTPASTNHSPTVSSLSSEMRSAKEEYDTWFFTQVSTLSPPPFLSRPPKPSPPPRAPSSLISGSRYLPHVSSLSGNASKAGPAKWQQQACSPARQDHISEYSPTVPATQHPVPALRASQLPSEPQTQCNQLCHHQPQAGSLCYCTVCSFCFCPSFLPVVLPLIPTPSLSHASNIRGLTFSPQMDDHGHPPHAVIYVSSRSSFFARLLRSVTESIGMCLDPGSGLSSASDGWTQITSNDVVSNSRLRFHQHPAPDFDASPNGREGGQLDRSNVWR